MTRCELIESILGGFSVRLREKYFEKNQPEVYSDINNFCELIKDLPFNQKVWHWVNEYSDYFKCNCGERTSFHKNWIQGYRKYCSPKCAQQNELSKEKRKNTVKLKYGVDNIAKLDETKKKQEQTNIERYGFKSSFQNTVVKEKWKTNVKLKYNVEHIFQLKSVKERSKLTSLEKFGTKYFVQSENYKKKLDEIGFSEKIKSSYINKHIEKYNNIDLDFVNITDRVLEVVSKKCGHTFSIHYDSLKRRVENGYEYCTICNPINSGQSQEEKILIDWIKSLSIEILEKDRKLGIELDIFIPSLNIAIEFNGLYWHSELYKDKFFHLNKTKTCRQHNIELIHIWEDDWIYKKEIVKSIILNRLNLIKNKKYARNCEIKLINKVEKDIFLDANHIQGTCVSKINIALFHQTELVSLMTFGERYINGKKEFELLRFCNKINSVVIGSASKLFNYFILNYRPNSITSFADISQFTGGLYQKLGFSYVHTSSPNYWWVVDGLRQHRFNYNKKRLVKQGFDANLTECQIMYDRGYFRIFGCGQDKYHYKFI